MSGLATVRRTLSTTGFESANSTFVVATQSRAVLARGRDALNGVFVQEMHVALEAVEAAVDPVEAPIDPVEAPVDPVEALVDFSERLIDTVEPFFLHAFLRSGPRVKWRGRRYIVSLRSGRAIVVPSGTSRDCDEDGRVVAESSIRIHSQDGRTCNALSR
jgi:hypothetical protein